MYLLKTNVQNNNKGKLFMVKQTVVKCRLKLSPDDSSKRKSKQLPVDLIITRPITRQVFDLILLRDGVSIVHSFPGMDCDDVGNTEVQLNPEFVLTLKNSRLEALVRDAVEATINDRQNMSLYIVARLAEMQMKWEKRRLKKETKPVE
ncbi:MAG: hypothetical protein AAB657_04160 [Patescibacteria group bacterium]